MREFSIHPAELGDAAAIAAIFRALGWSAHLNALTPEAAIDRVRRHLATCAGDDGHTILVARDSAGVALGYVSVYWLPYLLLPSPEGHVAELFVHPEAAGQGIGTKLLDALLAEARTRGCSRLSVINMRHRESYQRGFYAGRGWQERTGAANLIYDLGRE